MSNWFYVNGILERRFLRVCAVRRCLVRYNADYDWAVKKLSEFMKRDEAVAVISTWAEYKKP